MASGGDVLQMLCPGIEWTIYGDNYDSINWYGKQPAITKLQFEEALDKYDALKIKEQQEKAKAKAAILERLGLSEQEAAVLLG